MKILKFKEFIQLNESGSAQADRIERKDVKATLDSYYNNFLSKIPGVISYEMSGSFESNLSKQDFGDIDLIIHISAETKPDAKRMFINEIEKSKYINTFEYKGKKKKYYNSGELITISFNQAGGGKGKTVQIDNIMALNQKEADFKKKFLDLPAERQGLVTGLIKVAATEYPDLLKPYNVKGDGFDFNISPVSLQLRNPQNEQIFYTQDWDIVEKIMKRFGLSTKNDFETMINKIKTLSQRSKDRIKGLFNKMITIKSGEVGTKKGDDKQKHIDLINQL